VTPGASAPTPAVDIALARNQKQQFILPASFVKGNLRAAMDQLVAERLIESELLDQMFGTASGQRRTGKADHNWVVQNEPERAGLIFGDLATVREADSDDGRTARVNIDDDLGAAKEGHLVFVEAPFKMGTAIEFSGSVLVLNEVIPGGVECDWEQASRALKLALSRLYAIGRMKSVGFGRVLDYELGAVQEIVPAQVSSSPLKVRVKYKIDRPFLIDSERHGGNLVIGSKVVPGSAIKALIARGLNASGVAYDTEMLAQTVVSHAHPAGLKKLPYSLSISENKLFCNLLRRPTAVGHKFQNDWKDSELSVREALGNGWELPSFHMSGRTRTKIDGEKLTAAYDEAAEGGEPSGKLFSQVLVDPGEHSWNGEITFPKSFEQAGLIVKLLETGLPGLGKTGAVVHAECSPVETRDQSIKDKPFLNLCLKTDAVLFDPQAVKGNSSQMLYEGYFAKLGLKLHNYFAQEALAGRYIALRYPVSKSEYMPWVLTKAGSVFRVAVENPDRVHEILDFGLPPAAGLSTDWQKFPFLRENGFGSVVDDVLNHEAYSRGIRL